MGTTNSRLCVQDLIMKIVVTCNRSNIGRIVFFDFYQIILSCHCYCFEPDLTCNEKNKVEGQFFNFIFLD